jgi:hypothetical protein
LYDAAQQAPEAFASSGADTSADPLSTEIEVVTPNAWVVDAFVRGNVGTFATTRSGQIERWQRSCSSSSMATSTLEADAAGLYSMGWDHSNPTRYAHALAVFAPAPLVGDTTTTTVAAPTTTTLPAPTTTMPAPTTTLPVTTTTTTTLAAPTTTLPGGRIVLDEGGLASRCAGASGDSVTLPGVAVGSQSDRVLVVTAGAEENDSDCDFAHVDAVATYGGVAMQKAATAVSDLSSWRTCSAVFYLLAPPAGSADVVV